jgi:hypothetical protein
MAARKKRVVKTVADENYSKLDEHAIWLNEYYKALRKSGFSVENSLWLIACKESYPEWMQAPTLDDIRNHIEDEEDE